MRAILLPTADDDTPSTRPATVKLRVSATCTNTDRLLKLSMITSRLITDASVR